MFLQGQWLEPSTALVNGSRFCQSAEADKCGKRINLSPVFVGGVNQAHDCYVQFSYTDTCAATGLLHIYRGWTCLLCFCSDTVPVDILAHGG